MYKKYHLPKQTWSQTIAREQVRSSKKQWRYITAASFFIGIIALGWVTITGKHGYFHLERLKAEEKDLRTMSESLSQEESTLREQVDALKKSPDVLEKVSRESLGVSRPNEVIYLFDESKNDSNVKKNGK
jgi:cell division protein FtsB